MAYNPRPSNMFRSAQANSKTPGGKKQQQQQQQQQTDHDLSLEPSDIIECLSDMGIQFHAEDLRNPTPLKVQYLYERFAHALMGVNRETVEPVIRAAAAAGGWGSGADGADQPLDAAQTEAAQLMAFHASLAQLMSECGLHNFSFTDMLRPEPERLRHVLSNVINFLRFRAAKTAKTDELMQRGYDTRDRIERLTDENAQLVARIAALKAQRARDEPAIAAARDVNRALTADLRSYKKKQTAVVRDTDRLKAERKAMAAKLADVQYLVQTTLRDCARLQPYIVDAPEQLQHVIADLGRSLAKEREAADAADRRARALQTSADSFAVVEADVATCIRLMEDCQRELARQDEHTRKLQRHRDSLLQKESEVREIELKEERLMRSLKNADEKLERAREHAAARREATKREMEALKAEHAQLSEERHKTTREIEHKNTRIDIKLKEMAETKAALEEEISLAKAEYDRLSSHIELYMTKMDQQMAAAT